MKTEYNPENCATCSNKDTKYCLIAGHFGPGAVCNYENIEEAETQEIKRELVWEVE